MAYQITLRKRVLKVLEDINEPYYSKIKEAITVLLKIQDRKDIKSLKAGMVTAFVWLIIVSSTIFLIKRFLLM